MKRPNLFLVTGLLALCLTAGHARADSDSDNRALLERVIELESEVKTLAAQKAPGNLAAPSGGDNAAYNTMAAPDIEMRLSALETQIRNLTGQVEQSTYQAQQNTANIQKLSTDLDFRMQQLEQHQAAMPVPVVAAADPNAITNQAPPVAMAPATTAVIANTAAPAVAAVNADAPATPEELYNRAYSEMQRKEYGTAQTDFKSFLATNQGSKLAPNAEYWLGEVYYAQGNYKLASATFADGYQKFPKGTKAPDNLLKLGLSLEQQNRVKDACTVLHQLLKDYPSAPDTVTSGANKGIKRMQCGS